MAEYILSLKAYPTSLSKLSISSRLDARYPSLAEGSPPEQAQSCGLLGGMEVAQRARQKRLCIHQVVRKFGDPMALGMSGFPFEKGVFRTVPLLHPSYKTRQIRIR